MDRARVSAIAHAEHPVMAPLSDDSVQRLLDFLRVSQGGHVADFGCGQGVWLVRLLQQRADLSGIGIDLSEMALTAAARAAEAVGVNERIEWVLGDATADAGTPTVPVSAALCVGSTHAFGGLEGTLGALQERVAHDGSVLLGEGFWEQPPSPGAKAVIGELPDLAELISICHRSGFHVVGGHVSTPAEWDHYEWSWIGSLPRWALDRRDTPDGAAALQIAREHLDEWLTGYRGQLGFVTLALRR
jgi:SAM-dependent methyltransferase